MATPNLYFGAWKPLEGQGEGSMAQVPTSRFVAPSVVAGTVRSGKTGIVTIAAEEALRTRVPTLIIDSKGDLPNLLLSFPRFDPDDLIPWIHPEAVSGSGSLEQVARELNELRRRSLATWAIGEAELRSFVETRDVRVVTPGSTAGERLNVLSAFEGRSSSTATDPELALETLDAALSLVLRLLGRDAQPAPSREHCLLGVLSQIRLRRGRPTSLGELAADLRGDPIDKIGLLGLDNFLTSAERGSLANALDTLLTSRNFCHWRDGTSLDVRSWLEPRVGRTPAVIVSLAHLAPEERALLLDLLLGAVLDWTRSLPSSNRLQALVAVDEVDEILSPSAIGPSHKPLAALWNQASEHGVGLMVTTRDPMSLEPLGLERVGLWWLGRHSMDDEMSRRLAAVSGVNPAMLYSAPQSQATLRGSGRHLTPPSFLIQDTRSEHGPMLLHPRWPMSLLRGPMSRTEIHLARELPLVGSRVSIQGNCATAGT